MNLARVSGVSGEKGKDGSEKGRENSIMPGLFSQKNLVQCDMQGNNYGLSLKKIKKIPKITFSASQTGSHFSQAPNLQCNYM